MDTEERAFEYNGYHVKLFADQAQLGGYWTWATFHREGDEKERTPRHRIPETFADPTKAMDAMEDFARRLVDEGTVSR